MSQEFYCEDDHAEMVENFHYEVLDYARSVSEQFAGDVDQIEWHLESQYPELDEDFIREVIEEVTGKPTTHRYHLITLPAA